MPVVQAPQQVLDREYLTARCQLIEVAAVLDRFDRACQAAGNGQADPRYERLMNAIRLLAERPERPDRAEQLLLHFTD